MPRSATLARIASTIRVAFSRSGSRAGASSVAMIPMRSGRAADRGRRLGGRRVRRRRVLELLLLAEQHVEHLGAQLLAPGQRDTGADQDDRDPARGLAPAANALARGVRECDRSVAGGAERLADLGVELLVLEQSRRHLAVGQTAIGLL